MPKRKNKQSKLSKLLKKLNPNTPAKRLLTFILVFAVIGGGYFLYKSFAATSVSGGVMPRSWHCYTPHPTIQQGSSGDCVKYVQATLAYYAGQKIAVDGNFGSATKQAVINLQAWFGLNKDGVVGPDTWEKVDYLIRPGNYGSSIGTDRAACKDFKVSGLVDGKWTANVAKRGSNPSNVLLSVIVDVKNVGTRSWGSVGRAGITNRFFSTDGRLIQEYSGTLPLISRSASLDTTVIKSGEIGTTEGANSNNNTYYFDLKNVPAGLYTFTAEVVSNVNPSDNLFFGPDCRAALFVIN